MTTNKRQNDFPPPDVTRRKVTASGGLEIVEDSSMSNEMIVRQAVASLKSKQSINIKKRNTYYNEPMKFVDSEVDLEEELQNFRVVSTVPEVSNIIKLGAVPLLGQLLVHENNDIICSTAEVIQELTDQERIEDPALHQICQSFAKEGIFQCLYEALRRLDDTSDDEKEGIEIILSIVEQLTESVDDCVESDELNCKQLAIFFLSKLTQHTNVSRTDTDVCYAEALSSLVQTSDLVAIHISKALVDKDGLLHASEKSERVSGMHLLLSNISKYIKNRDAVSDFDLVVTENIIDTLCAILLSAEGKSAFVASHGVKLLLLLIEPRRKKKSGKSEKKTKTAKAFQHMLKHSSLKCLSFSVQENVESCKALVEEDGLGILFGFYMLCGPSSVQSKNAEEIKDTESRVISIVNDLLENLAPPSHSDLLRRVVLKFNDVAKIEVLVRMIESTQSRLQAFESHLESSKKMIAEQYQLPPEEEEVERLNSGKLQLQQLACITAVVSTYDMKISSLIETQLSDSSTTSQTVLTILKSSADEKPKSNYLSDLINEYSQLINKTS